MPQSIGLYNVRRIGELQERAARAVPATAQENRDGSWLRYTDSEATWWAGAALLHGREPVRDLAAGIAAAEDFSMAHGGPARFQVCPACPPDLDYALARRGYVSGDIVSLQMAASGEIARRLSAPSLRVDLTAAPYSAWFELLMTAQGHDDDPVRERRLIQGVDLPSVYATVFASNRPVAVGRAVADTGWVGVFSMATLSDARRRGAASAVLTALADWAISRSCPNMYLQVPRNSAEALGVYRRAGFEELCAYHYRTAALT